MRKIWKFRGLLIKSKNKTLNKEDRENYYILSLVCALINTSGDYVILAFLSDFVNASSDPKTYLLFCK
jgi:hypothetical protein